MSHSRTFSEGPNFDCTILSCFFCYTQTGVLENWRCKALSSSPRSDIEKNTPQNDIVVVIRRHESWKPERLAFSWHDRGAARRRRCRIVTCTFLVFTASEMNVEGPLWCCYAEVQTLQNTKPGVRVMEYDKNTGKLSGKLIGNSIIHRHIGLLKWIFK